MAELAAGRTLVIGYFASSRCGVAVGDLSVDWGGSHPASGYMELAPIEGVHIAIDARLADVLAQAGPELRPGGILRPGTPSIRLARPERWIDFLDDGPWRPRSPRWPRVRR